jgi:glycogen debranching enzyme
MTQHATAPSRPRRGPRHPEHSQAEETRQVSRQTREERKTRVLTQGTASIVRSISDAVVAKDGEPFFLCPPNGQIDCNDGHGYGLYHDDCRFLGGYELHLAGAMPNSLAATEAAGTQLVLELTNPDIRMDNGSLIKKEELGITWTRRVVGRSRALEDTIQIRNYSRDEVAFPVELRFAARFEDVFQIRGLLTQQGGQRHEPRWDGQMLRFSYSGADGIDRLVDLSFEPAPDDRGTSSASFALRIAARDRVTLRVTARLGERPRPGATPMEQRGAPSDRPAGAPVRLAGPDPSEDWVGSDAWATSVRTDSLLLDAALARSLGDLQLLRSGLDGHRYYEAGIPWFATLFGRDALITALEALAFDQSMAADTLRLLAGKQGQRFDDWRDEEPGKMVHELRIGELARLEDIPQTPYYGTVDATPLFLMLLGRHAAWTGRLDLFHELRAGVEGALLWLSRHGDHDGDGYLDYESETKHSLVNQGWKDSGNAIVTADGDLAEPPIALVEAQGYAYRAWLETADLFERSGDPDRAADLRKQAAAMRERFERDFWSAQLDCYVLALANGSPCEVVASNAGHALWTGIADREHAARVASRLMEPDMFNGWGIRTLSTRAAAYQPIGYHLGTVWPHDNALIAAGLRGYGHDDAAERLFLAQLEAASHFAHARLPECFSGYDRSEYGAPVRYPVACHPQAWAAGAVPQLLTTSLGLQPEAFERRLRIVRPRVPRVIGQIELRGLPVGDARAHLRFVRSDSETRVEVIGVDGRLDVEVER